MGSFLLVSHRVCVDTPQNGHVRPKSHKPSMGQTGSFNKSLVTSKTKTKVYLWVSQQVALLYQELPLHSLAAI